MYNVIQAHASPQKLKDKLRESGHYSCLFWRNSLAPERVGSGDGILVPLFATRMLHSVDTKEKQK